MSGLFGHLQGWIGLFPDSHASLFGQVGVADPEGKDRTKVSRCGSQLHAAYFKADKERNIFGCL